MFVTVITTRRGKAQIQQVEAPTVKDCLVVWAGSVAVEGQDDAGRTRLRGDMADFDRAPVAGFGSVWRFESDLGLGEGQDGAIVVVVETARH